MMVRWQVVLLAALALLVGCNPQAKPRPLTPAAFTRKTDMEPLSRADQPGDLLRNPSVAPAPQVDDASGGYISKIVQENVGPAVAPVDFAAPATTASSTRPSTGPTTIGVSTAQYFEVGGVVMRVNDTPIYAHTVIKRAEPVLAARAKELDEAQFRRFAKSEITDQVAELRNDQLEYAAAERNLDERDKDHANLMTMAWKQQQIAAAGGSLTVARQRAAAQGENFDELVQQQYRKFMSQLYNHKKVWPRVQVSADDIRQYYERNRDREFSNPAAARFRLIKIDPQKHGGREGALRFANELRNRIVRAGESFALIAGTSNDDPRLLKSGGDLGTAIQKGAFAIGPVDQAVWETEVGQVTPVIDTPGAFYIALVEEKTVGKVQPFDEAAQTKIENTLSGELFRKERMREREILVKNAVWTATPQMMNIALEMAMQNYPRWAGKN